MGFGGVLLKFMVTTKNLFRIEVYKDGIKIPYESGRPDGYQSMQYLREKPGVYNWKDGKEYFEREFTQEEWDSHNKMNEYLNRNNKVDSTLIKDN